VEHIFAVQDEISESIAAALHQMFSSFSTKGVDPAVYDLYLRASPKSFAPDELRSHISLLEIVTERAPHFGEAWSRLAALRGWLHVYLPFADRPATAARAAREVGRALECDLQSVEAMMAQLFIARPSGAFSSATRSWSGSRNYPLQPMDAIRRLRPPHNGTGSRGPGARRAHLSFGPAASDDCESRRAREDGGRARRGSCSVFEDSVERLPDTSFPVSSPLRLCIPT
jgi:hypothetical protein